MNLQNSKQDKSAEEFLKQLSEAEDDVCKLLKYSADTCAELQKLPFTDTKIYQRSFFLL